MSHAVNNSAYLFSVLSHPFFFFLSLLIYRYESQLHKFCKFMDFILESHAPETLHGDSYLIDWLRDKLHKSVFWTRCLQHALSLGQKDMV